jgi:hypothetical protein
MAYNEALDYEGHYRDSVIEQLRKVVGRAIRNTTIMPNFIRLVQCPIPLPFCQTMRKEY